MHTEVKNNSDYEVTIKVIAGEESLKQYKLATLKRLQPEVSAPGFRKGKVPLNLVEKQVDEKYLQSQFLDEALSSLFSAAIDEHAIRPVDRPKVEIGKFVPYSEMEFSATVEVMPKITLPDYKKIKKERKKTTVTAKDVNEVIENLRKRFATKEDVKRAAKTTDEVIIDFAGKDAEGKAVSGATGKDYPLTLGSDTFIPGFEDELVGLKKDETKTFTIRFPKDYQHKPLANKDVTFEVTIKAVKSVKLAAADNTLAKESGPFKTITELKDDIKKQLVLQKEQEGEAEFKDAVIEAVVSRSKLTPPPSLVAENIQALLDDFKQNLVYRGITFSEYLEQAGVTEEEHIENEVKPQAERRVKIGLVLAEIAEKEKIEITPEELEIRMQLVRGQFQGDERMAEQLNSPDAQRDIASRIMTEKTIDKLVEYATAK